jgi:hypothetical protein
MVSLWCDGNILKVDCDDGCPTFYIYEESLESAHKTREFYGMKIIPLIYKVDKEKKAMG